MAEVQFDNLVSSGLAKILDADEIKPGDDVGYKLCKDLWMFHPLGGKMVEKPIMMALCKTRAYEVETDPGERVVRRFTEVWERMKVEEKIRNLFFHSRCYGAASIGVGTHSEVSSEPLPDFGLKEEDVFINVWDPLNISGSAVTSQDPNSAEFQEPKNTLQVTSKKWHPSRTQTVFNGTPIYLEYQPSTFGFTGRSVFQRCLYPMKSFISTMVANNLAAQKCGVIVTKTQQNGSMINGITAFVTGKKREVIKMSENGGVVSIGIGEDVESLNLQNIDKTLDTVRNNIISDIATGCDVPAALLKDEAFAVGWSDGSEDSKAVSQYIDGVRQGIDPVISFFERIVQYIAWDEDFYNALKAEYPDIITEDYQTTFYRWRREFTASWVELVAPPENEEQEAESKVVQQAVAVFVSLVKEVDPKNRAKVADWLANILNNTTAFGDSPLILDMDSLSTYQPPVPSPGPFNETEQQTGGGHGEE
ncbi:anti-CBASS protein Acb1 family protein [Enterobacter ludwigii]|uniref:anti-CBASS protein Acb1 family protein n=1 Tax=Enterobacter ludwigii TaxID=299767 RepID=UPI001065B5FB|nr:anti-CBASS Acb1 family protein [Enterobacter ludwigii]